ncbi:uncharacterized protein LOC129969338 [Argiope bruennichi]|uniref:uncharacterized protein LOC129969338 n=1 Tax=Argiope bruennichi TaxID=94029 RepID=UPI002494257F|nr:uncharacterized protein LOC129969338 [Argiope bruennichi]
MNKDIVMAGSIMVYSFRFAESDIEFIKKCQGVMVIIFIKCNRKWFGYNFMSVISSNFHILKLCYFNCLPYILYMDLSNGDHSHGIILLFKYAAHLSSKFYRMPSMIICHLPCKF